MCIPCGPECNTIVNWDCWLAGDPESKDDVEADTSGDETDPVDSGHKARDEMFCAVASIRVGYWTPETTTNDMWLAFGWCLNQKLTQHVKLELNFALEFASALIGSKIGKHVHLSHGLLQGRPSQI